MQKHVLPEVEKYNEARQKAPHMDVDRQRDDLLGSILHHLCADTSCHHTRK